MSVQPVAAKALEEGGYTGVAENVRKGTAMF